MAWHKDEVKLAPEDTPHTSPSNVLSPVLAHEINNPLNAILNLLELLKSEVTSEKGRNCLLLLDQEVSHVSEMARSSLNGRIGEERQVATLSKLIRNVLDLFESTLAAKRIGVTTRLDDSSIYIASGQIRNVLCNLVLNAIHALPTGGKLVVRTCAGHEWTGTQRQGIRITVADNGSGITSDRMARIFEPFFTTKGRDGTGLGLCLVRDIVHRHSGTIRVRSTTRPGRSGTAFVFFLPYSALSQVGQG